MRNTMIRNTILSGVFIALIIALGYVAVPLPFMPVPITGQTLGILLIGLLLTPKHAFTTLSVWVLMGTFFPVFSKFRNLSELIAGGSWGYVLGFVLCATFIAFFRAKSMSTSKDYIQNILVCAFGSIFIIYACGVVGLMITFGMPFDKAMTVGVLPFLVGDTIKLGLALTMARALEKPAKLYFAQ